MNLFLFHVLVFHCLFLSYEFIPCSNCCTTTGGNYNSVEVSCSSIMTESSFSCLNECLIYVSNYSNQQPLDVKLSDCSQSLFPDNYFESFTMAGLGMQKCGLTEIPSRIYGKSCSTMANQMLLGTNGITTIDPTAFIYCTQLTSLDLSNNHLTKINNADFQSLSALAMLTLTGNKIESVEGFGRSTVIVDIYLQSNIISNISSKAFAGMTGLRTLFLYQNVLQTLEDGVFDLLQLTSLKLDSNPFVCDCSLKWLQTWLRARPTLKTKATCASPKTMIGPLVLEPFCISTTAGVSNTTSQSTSTSSTPLTSSSTASTSQTAQSTSDSPNALTTPLPASSESVTTHSTSTSTTSLAISSTVLSSTTSTPPTTLTSTRLESSTDPTTSPIQNSTSDSPTSTTLTTTSVPVTATTEVQSSTTQILTSSQSTSLFTNSSAPTSSTVFIPISQSSIFSTDVTAFSTPDEDNKGDCDEAIVSYIDIQDDMTLVWSTNESKVMILFGPINGNCSNYTINQIFGNMTEGVHAIVVANQSEYQIQVDNNDQLYLVCITNAQLNINIKNLYCNTSCLTTFSSLPSTVPTTNPISTSQSTIPLSIAIGIICAVVFICLIIITVLLCVLRSTPTEKKNCVGNSNSGNARPRPLPARPSNDIQQTIKCPPERNGLPNPLYNEDDNSRDNRSYLYLEPSIPEGCDIDEPINSATYEIISLKESESESKNLTPLVSVD